VRIFGEPYEVRAEIANIDGLSSHAGQDLLTKYAVNVKNSVKQVFLVHGEPAPAAALMAKLKEQNMDDLYYPDMHTSAEL
jgi:metallo-beta-lactamase family protein